MRLQALVRVVGFSAAVIVAMIAFVPAATALHISQPEVVYWSGNLAPQAGQGTWGYPCHSIWGSRARWGAASQRAMTVALISTSGGWVRSARSTAGVVGVTYNIGASQTLKAYCKNSGTATFPPECSYGAAVYDGCV